jgi:hypothetical protein
MIDKLSIKRYIAMMPKKTSGTLYSRTSGDTFNSGTAYAYCYQEPNPDESGITTNGTPGISGYINLYQFGESTAPLPDDRFVDSNGTIWHIQNVTVKMQFGGNYGIHRMFCMQIS